MAVGGDLRAPALAANVRFNWVFLVELLVCGFITIFFLFYFNRLFAKLISILARLYLRWLGNPHYIDVQSLQISLLAGRLFFGKVTYHGPNETIVIVGGHITWRYWLRRVRQVSPSDAHDSAESHGRGGGGKPNALPCRILVEMKGVEWFVYNRSPQYDWVMEEMIAAGGEEDCQRRPPHTPPPNGDHLNGDCEDGKQTPKTGSTTLASNPSNSGTTVASPTESFEDIVASSPYLRTLPIKVECNRGAVVMGNNNTPSILVAHFEKAHGTIDARKSRSIDKYTQIFDLSFTHPTVHLKPNSNYKEALLFRGAREQATNLNATIPQPNLASQTRTQRQRFCDLFPLLAASVESFAPSRTPRLGSSDQQRGQWMGLSRYLDEPEQLEGWKFEPEEYATVSNILDCQSATFCLFWDVVGTVPASEPRPREGGKERNGNSNPAPEFGLDLSFTSGTINYGPWADRQRIHLQNMFFPKLFKTAKPAQPLAPGEDRTYTEFKIFVQLSSSTVLSVPLREESKDWKYRRRLEDGEVRPIGWLEVRVGNESTLTYNMAYAASLNGWAHTLGLELRDPEVRSSVNHNLLWKANLQTLQCDLSGPLRWNGDTKWVFDNVSSGMQVFLLREHVTLLTDLVMDWTSGPGQEYWTFIPMIYELNLKLEDCQFHFNVNDQNIINNPSSFEDNTFLVLRNMGGQGGYLQGRVQMDFREFRPQSSVVEFTAETASVTKGGGLLEVGVRTPVWNTWNCSLKQQESLGKVEQVKLKGSYEFFGNTSSDVIDTLTLDLDGEGLELALHGFLIRYFLTLKENYFGENLHFKTLEEWQNQERVGADGIALGPSAPFVKSNDLDVLLHIRARDLAVLLPKHIYDSREHLRFSMPSLGLDMRFTNYYMDLQVDLAPLSAFLGGSCSKLPEVFIDGIAIFGHRLFGLPPLEPTYVCNWDLNIGAIAGECSLDFLQTFIFGIKAFAFSVRDTENALPLLVETLIHDVTFIRLNVATIRLWLHTNGSSVFRLAVDEISFVLNDLADNIHSERITLKIPGLNIAIMGLQSQGAWRTKGYLETEVNITMLNRKHRANNSRRLQQKHVGDSDERTGRARFLLSNEYESRSSSTTFEPGPTTMAFPGLPLPLYNALRSTYGRPNGSFTGSDSSRTSQTSSRKSSRSFLAGSVNFQSVRMTSLLRVASSHAPSFHSAVESLSDLSSAFPESHAVPAWGIPTTTTTPRSKGSLRIPTPPTRSFRHVSLEMTSRPLGVSLSSPFSRPTFPLDEIEPDLTGVPVLDGVGDHPAQHTPENVDLFVDEESSRDSIIIELHPGIRGFCAPSAMKDVAVLLEHIQPHTPDDVLDFIQIKAVSKLAEVVKKVDVHGRVLEACLRLPQLKFSFMDDIPAEQAHTSRSTEESYTICLNLRNLVFAVRSKKDVRKEGGAAGSERIRSTLSVHFLANSLSVTLKDLTMPLPHLRLSTRPAFGILVGEFGFWASTSETSTATLQLKTLTTSVQGDQSLFLHDVSVRVAAVFERIQKRYSALASLEQGRIQHFLSALATAGEEHRITQDPATLTRPSYVLRSATNHVRLNDSWKISTRLRHIWQSLPVAEKGDWTVACLENACQQPSSSAKDNLTSVLQRWRGWELGNIKDSVMIKQIFGDECSSTPGPAKGLSLNAKIAIESIRLLVDPGPTQHEFSIDHLSGSVVIGNPGLAGSLGDTTAVTPGVTANTVVQVHSRNIRLGARWEALDVFETLAKGLKTRYKEALRPPIRTSQPSSLTSGPERKEHLGGFHLILAADHGSLSLDTVNLRISTMIHNARASVVLSEKDIEAQGGRLGSVGSLLLRADYGTSEVCYGNKILSKAIIRTPSLYGYFDEHWLAETQFHISKFTGSSEEISLDIQEQVLGLLEVVDFVVADELSHIRRLISNIEEAHSEHELPGSSSPSQRKVQMVYCTLSLDQFSLRATLLPSLGYMVRGGGVRLAARPHSKDSKEMMIVDFGLEHHEHEICKSVEQSEENVISLLRLPAITANFRDYSTDEERLVEAAVSVEAISLEASAIQSLLNAIKKPEVLKVVENVRAEWRGIDVKLGEIFGHQRKPKPSKKLAKPLVYRAYVGVSGLTIETLAPSANLVVNLGIIQVHASNRPNSMEPVLSFLDILLEFGKVTVELTRTTENGLQDICGSLELHASLHASSQQTEAGNVRAFYAKSHSLKINLFAETASAVVDVVGHLQDKLRDLDLSREVKYLKRNLRNAKPLAQSSPNPDKSSQLNLFNMVISMDMVGIQVSWIVGGSQTSLSNGYPKHNLVFSFKRINLSTATRRSNEANLIIEEFLLQMVDANSMLPIRRSENSALMPEVTFKVAYSINSSERRLAFQANGRSLDLRVTSDCVVAANSIQSSITTAVQKFKDASSSWKLIPTRSGAERTNMFGKKRMASVLVDADFAGAVVHLASRPVQGTGLPGTHQGNYGQFATGEEGGITMLKTPGLAFKVEYSDSVGEDPSLSAEIKISASDNTLYPSVVPLVLEMSDNVKEIMQGPSEAKGSLEEMGESVKESTLEDHHLDASNPAAILGKCRLNVGLRICRQEFTLSCQPIARVAASTGYDQIYATISTCDDSEGHRFYSTSATITGLKTSLQHVYSRESAGTLEVDAVTLSLMNNKHVMGSAGLSCMMKSSPIKSQINIKQFQDFLLFREIWYPAPMRDAQSPAPLVTSGEPSPMLVQRYHKVAATNAFPWNATLAIAGIDLQLDLGQSLGKSALLVSSLWVTSRKTSDWEQTMCLGFDSIRISSSGRLSGYIDMKSMKVRTSINWDSAIESLDVVQTPLVEASIGFGQLQVKIVFDYQAFLLADIGCFNFLMYNLQNKGATGDRLVGVLDGDRVQIFCTTSSAAQGLALYQACQRLAQDKMASFEVALKDVESYLNRRSSQLHSPNVQEKPLISGRKPSSSSVSSGLFKLHTDVVVNLKEAHFGVFPSTFYDSQIFKIEALNATARFAVNSNEKHIIHSMLELTLGELSIALSPVRQEGVGTALADVGVGKVIEAIAFGKLRSGNKGIILRVPQVTALMHTWHTPGSMAVDFSFKSSFEGKVDVGWNFERVGIIKNMYHNHAKMLALRQGKPPVSPRITMYTDVTPGSAESSDPTIAPESPGSDKDEKRDKNQKAEKGKITAIVDVPQSKYEYNATEPVIIETPQLRDMGEATPPMEWIGLHRERLPHLTHQIVIVSLLEVAREVEDVYSKVLGSS